MDKYKKFYLNSTHTCLICDIFINGHFCMTFQRNLLTYSVVSYTMTTNIDVTTFDLELHAFLRLSHQYIVNPDSLAGEKIEEMFELECPNI